MRRESVLPRLTEEDLDRAGLTLPAVRAATILLAPVPAGRKRHLERLTDWFTDRWANWAPATYADSEICFACPSKGATRYTAVIDHSSFAELKAPKQPTGRAAVTEPHL
jgi:hypothetical protein